MLKKRAATPAAQPTEPGLKLASLAGLSDDQLIELRRAAQEEEASQQRAATRGAAVAAHGAAEQAEAPRLDQLGSDLTTADQRQAASMQAAVDALIELFDDTRARNQQVTDGAAALQRCGLSARYSDADGVVDFDTGAGPNGRSLMLRGQGWATNIEATVLYAALSQALAARLGQHAPQVREIRHGRGVASLERLAPNLFPAA